MCRSQRKTSVIIPQVSKPGDQLVSVLLVAIMPVFCLSVFVVVVVFYVVLGSNSGTHTY